MLDIINSFDRRGYTQCGSTELHSFVNLNMHGKESTACNCVYSNFQYACVSGHYEIKHALGNCQVDETGNLTWAH